MTQEQKDLLIKDLCARVPYGVKVRCEIPINQNENKEIVGQVTSVHCNNSIVQVEDFDVIADYNPPFEIKPYLFPLSSMTEEQYYEMQSISGKDCLEHMEVEKEWRNNSPFNHLPLYQHKVIEFFHKHHFDYRGLIPMGLAIDATGKNIY